MLLANGCGSWLSYSGVVRVLFPEQLRAVAERLCRCHVIHAVSVLKVSMWGAGVSPGVHRRFSDSATFFSGWKEIGPLCRDLLPKRKLFLQRNERFGGGQTNARRALPPPSGSECRQTRRIHNSRLRNLIMSEDKKPFYIVFNTNQAYSRHYFFTTMITVRVDYSH